MIDDSPGLQRRYRAPRAFGPMPGPRNIPAAQREVDAVPQEVTTSLSVSLEADPAELARLLPAGTRLSGPAVLSVTVTRLENLLWLAGRGYPVLTVTFPVEYRDGTADDGLTGRYLAVLWEGLADPVTTGRDELGFPKLPADIRGVGLQDVSASGTVDAEATWDGFRFVEVSAHGLQPSAVAAPTPNGTIVHRYVPSLTDPGRADVDQLVFHPLAAAGQRSTVTDRLSGSGSFRFHHARFVDSPVQYPVVNTLAALSLSATGPATLTRSTAAAGGTAGAWSPRILGAATGATPRITAGAAA